MPDEDATIVVFSGGDIFIYYLTPIFFPKIIILYERNRNHLCAFLQIMHTNASMMQVGKLLNLLHLTHNAPFSLGGYWIAVKNKPVHHVW
jgi:hypothetical protein